MDNPCDVQITITCQVDTRIYYFKTFVSIDIHCAMLCLAFYVFHSLYAKANCTQVVNMLEFVQVIIIILPTLKYFVLWRPGLG